MAANPEHDFAATLALLKQKAAAREQAKPAPLSGQAYLARLAALDCSSGSAVAAFVADTQVAPVDPVPLGVHQGVEYALLSTLDTVPEGANPSLVATDDVCDGVRVYQKFAIPGTPLDAPDIRFGLGLGRLQYRIASNSSGTGGGGGATGGGSAASGDMGGWNDAWDDAGFFVLLNALDRSLWVAIDWFPTVNEKQPLTVVGDDQWGRLPQDKDLQIGVMRISKDRWWEKKTPTDDYKINDGDPFRMYPALGCRLEARMARKGEFMAAWKTAHKQ